MEAPARIDGGDVLVLGRRLLVGVSNRTDAAGLRALADAVRPFGYERGAGADAGVPAPEDGGHHRRSRPPARQPGVGRSGAAARPRPRSTSPRDEPWAANVLSVAGAVVAAAGFPRTADRLRARGLDVRTVDVSEFQKAEGGVTCKSLVFDVAEPARRRE